MMILIHQTLFCTKESKKTYLIFQIKLKLQICNYLFIYFLLFLLWFE